MICHGGVGLSASTLLAGRSLLTLPLHLEQSLLSYRLARRGLAVSIGKFDCAPDFVSTIEQVLADEAMRENVARFSRDRGGRSNADTAREVAARISASPNASKAGPTC